MRSTEGHPPGRIPGSGQDGRARKIGGANLIPQLIHQTTTSASGLPAEIRQNMSRLRAMNPAWKHRVYDSNEQRAYLCSHLPQQYISDIERINPKYGVVIANVFKYLLLYNEGGVYLDDKSTCNRPLETALPPSTSFLLSHWRNGHGQTYQGWGLHSELGDPRRGGEFQQWFMVARPRHPFL